MAEAGPAEQQQQHQQQQQQHAQHQDLRPPRKKITRYHYELLEEDMTIEDLDHEADRLKVTKKNIMTSGSRIYTCKYTSKIPDCPIRYKAEFDVEKNTFNLFVAKDHDEHIHTNDKSKRLPQSARDLLKDLMRQFPSAGAKKLETELLRRITDAAQSGTPLEFDASKVTPSKIKNFYKTHRETNRAHSEQDTCAELVEISRKLKKEAGTAGQHDLIPITTTENMISRSGDGEVQTVFAAFSTKFLMRCLANHPGVFHSSKTLGLYFSQVVLVVRWHLVILGYYNAQKRFIPCVYALANSLSNVTFDHLLNNVEAWCQSNGCNGLVNIPYVVSDNYDGVYQAFRNKCPNTTVVTSFSFLKQRIQAMKLPCISKWDKQSQVMKDLLKDLEILHYVTDVDEAEVAVMLFVRKYETGSLEQQAFIVEFKSLYLTTDRRTWISAFNKGAKCTNNQREVLKNPFSNTQYRKMLAKLFVKKLTETLKEESRVNELDVPEKMLSFAPSTIASIKDFIRLCEARSQELKARLCIAFPYQLSLAVLQETIPSKEAFVGHLTQTINAKQKELDSLVLSMQGALGARDFNQLQMFLPRATDVDASIKDMTSQHHLCCASLEKDKEALAVLSISGDSNPQSYFGPPFKPSLETLKNASRFVIPSRKLQMQTLGDALSVYTPVDQSGPLFNNQLRNWQELLHIKAGDIPTYNHAAAAEKLRSATLKQDFHVLERVPAVAGDCAWQCSCHFYQDNCICEHAIVFSEMEGQVHINASMHPKSSGPQQP